MQQIYSIKTCFSSQKCCMIQSLLSMNFFLAFKCCRNCLIKIYHCAEAINWLCTKISKTSSENLKFVSPHFILQSTFSEATKKVCNEKMTGWALHRKERILKKQQRKTLSHFGPARAQRLQTLYNYNYTYHNPFHIIVRSQAVVEPLKVFVLSEYYNTLLILPFRTLTKETNIFI